MQNVQSRLDEMTLDASGCLQVGQSMLTDDMPELAEGLARRCEGDYGECPEAMLLNAMIERYRFNEDAAERLVATRSRMMTHGLAAWNSAAFSWTRCAEAA